VKHYQTTTSSINWWLIGLLAVIVIGALPFLFGLAMDGKGQSASGWLHVIGGMFSAALASLLLVIYFAGTLFSAIYKFIF
jgi:uncharacterized membrane protein